MATQSRVTQVACYSCELTCCLCGLVHKWKVQSRGVHRDFHGLARDSLAGRSSNRKKHFEFFFIILTLSVLAACPGDLLATRFSHKKRVFCVSKTVFKTFSVFPSTFCDCSLSSPFLSQLKLTQTLLKLHFCIISSPIFKKKVWVFSVSLHFPCFKYAFLDSVSVLLPLCFEKYHARSRVCFILVSVHWLRVSVFDFITGVSSDIRFRTASSLLSRSNSNASHNYWDITGCYSTKAGRKPLAIRAKKGESSTRMGRSVHIERGSCVLTYIYTCLYCLFVYGNSFMFWIIVVIMGLVWYTVVMVNVWFKLITHG